MPILTTLGAACAKAWGFTSGLITDQYFNLVSLLLPGNGTNGKQNNAFIDSSTANSGTGWPITPNGDVTQGTFSPFSQTGWGAYFAGSGARISTTSGSQFSFGTNDFTVEFWMYPTSSSSNVGIFDTRTANNNGLIIRLGDGASDPNVVSAYVAGTELNTKAITYNSWQHVAVVRNSGNGVIYVNGVGSTSKAASGDCTQTGCLISALYDALTSNFVGYLSNFRVVKGKAVYTSNFQPATSNLGATTGGSSPPTGTQTSLLTLQSNRFVDNGGLATPNTLTITNSVSVTPFSPFAPTSSYSAAAVGGSGYFDDGGGDYLSVADNAAFDYGSGNVTLECWVYVLSTSDMSIVHKTNAGSDTPGNLALRIASSKFQALVDSNDAFPADLTLTGATTVTANQWYHVAVVRNGSGSNNWVLYVNGNSDATGTYTGSTTNAATPLYVGFWRSGDTQYLNGYLSNLRIVKGTAVYTAAFTPPTAPLTNITNTSLLLNFTNAGVVDATAKNVLETEGNAQISTAQSKWGGGSLYLPQSGTTDYFFIGSDTKTLLLGTGVFVIELWFKTTSSTQYAQIIGNENGASGDNGFTLLMNVASSTSGEIAVYRATSGQINITSASYRDGNWHHLAFVRDSSGSRLYVDGSQQGSTNASQASTTFDASGGVRWAIGENLRYPGRTWAGNIDDIRITRGNNRGYTGSSITVPTAPFPLQ